MRLKIFLLAFLFLSCSPWFKFGSERKGDVGEPILLVMKNGFQYRGELVAVEDSGIVFRYMDKVYGVNFVDINRIKVVSYRLRKRRSLLITLLAVADVPLILSLYRISGGVWVIFAASVPVIAAVSSSKYLNFKPPLGPGEISILKSYSRYPKGLTVEDKRKLLKFYGQKKFLSLSG